MLLVFTVLQMRHTPRCDGPGGSVGAVNGRVGGLNATMEEVSGAGGGGGAVTPEVPGVPQKV